MKVEPDDGLELNYVIISSIRERINDGQDLGGGPEDGKKPFNFRCKIIWRRN